MDEGDRAVSPAVTASPLDMSVRILSLNCWGLKYVSKLRAERLRMIAQKLSQSPQYDIVALQELWVDEDFELIRVSVSSHLPYAKRFSSGILAGPGLSVFSKWPISESWLHRFPINGRPSAFFRGDWYVGKSVSGVIIQHPSGTTLEVLNSHMHAPYGPKGDAAYVCHRAAQAWDISRLARRATKCGHVTFAVGDFNSRPGSMHYKLLEDVGQMSDAWVQAHGEFSGDISKLTPQEQIDLAGVTADSQLCSWREKYALNRAKRLDYIFFDRGLAQVRECKVAFTEKTDGISMSDHFGIEGLFDLASNPREAETLRPHVAAPAKIKLFEEVLVTISQYYGVAKWQSTWRSLHFLLSIVVTIGLLIAVWFAAAHNRAWVGFIFIITAVVIMVTGVVDGLIALLFGRSEKRALAEFEHEVWDARHLLTDQQTKSAFSTISS